MSTVLTIGGSAVSNSRLVIGKLQLKLKGIDTFTFYVRGGPLTTPDPYVGQPCSVAIGGTTYFTGDVVSASPEFGKIGYVFAYQCMGLRNRGDWVPLTDDNTGTDTSLFNLQPDNPNYIASRAGRTVGEIITDVLLMQFNAGNLSFWGIGNYSGTFPSISLPSDTVSDLAALTLIPPHEVYVQGEKLLSAIDGFLSNDAPNVALYVQPDGTMRFLDQRTFTNHVFTLDSDPIDPVAFSHDTSECFSRVQIRGQPNTVPVLVTLSGGTLTEDFAWGSLSNTAAKAAWVPTDYSQPGTAQDSGTCTCSSTTTVVVTSSDNTLTWTTDAWDQSAFDAQGVIYLTSSTAGGLITQSTSRKIVSNTSLSAGGTSTLTLDYALEITSYDTYFIHGNVGGASLVYRNYLVANTALGAAMASQFNYPVPFVSSSGDVATLVSTPTASICYSASGSPPYDEEPLQFTQDASSGTITTFKPTSLIFGGGTTTTPASDVRVLLAINQTPNQVFAPVNTGSPPVTPAYEGTFFTADLASDTSRSKTLVVTVSDWRDPTAQGNLQAYAQDVLDSVKDTIYEGTIVYYGLFTSALTFGLAATVTGSTYTTGWETLTSFSGFPGLPVVEVELEWDQSSASIYKTTLHCSNRRAQYSASEFLRPARGFVPLGFDATGAQNQAFSDFSLPAPAPAAPPTPQVSP